MHAENVKWCCLLETVKLNWTGRINSSSNSTRRHQVIWIDPCSLFEYLSNHASDMEREWPHREAQTKAALKKERPLQEKVLADVKRKVTQVEKMLKPALENSSLSANITREAEQTAHAMAKVQPCVACVSLLEWCLLAFHLFLTSIFSFLPARRNPNTFWLRPSTAGPHLPISARILTLLYACWLSKRR